MGKSGVHNPYDISETGNWNNAKFYAGLLAHHIANILDYREICYFGSNDLMMEMMSDEQSQTRAKIKALYRWIKTEQFLIKDSMFAIKSGKIDRDKLNEYSKVLVQVEKMYPLIKSEQIVDGYNGRMRIIKINESEYRKIINILDALHELILDPLNKNDLIFLGSDDYNPFEAKQKLMKELSEKG